MKECRKKWRRFFGDEGRVCGVLFGILCFVVLTVGLLSPWRLGTIDTGKYERIMDEAGLRYTEEEIRSERPLTYDHVIEEFEYGKFSYAKLVSPSGIHSIVYPVALIRALTEPFGVSFSVKYLYLLYALLASFSVYVITRGVTELFGVPGVIMGILQVLLLADGNVNAYFASLYDTGTVLIGFLLVTASAIRAISYGRGRGVSAALPLVLSSVFLLNASAISVVFLPFVCIAAAVVCKQEWQFLTHRNMVLLFLVGFLAIGCCSQRKLMNNHPDIQSEAAVYHSAFQGFLETSDDPQRDLSDFGLEEDYVQDIGKSYYMEENAYRHNPRDEKEAEELFSKLNRDTIWKWYLRDPVRIIRTVLGQSEKFYGLESQRLLKPGQSSSEEEKTSRVWSAADMALSMILPADYSLALILMGVGGILTGIALIFRIGKKKKGVLSYALLFWSWELGALGYVPVHLIFMGRESLELSRIFAVAAIPLICGMMLSFLGKCGEYVSGWFRELQTEKTEILEDELLSTEEGVYSAGKDWSAGIAAILKKWYFKIAADEKKTLLLVSVAAVAMAASVLLADPRAGCVNNGDYGRMMDQLGLIWQGDVFYDVEAQLGKRVIEEYAYVEAFQPAALTFLSPRYSLIFPAAIVRGICSILNRPFSTYILSIVMTAVLLICLISIVRDLYAFLGKGTVLAGLGLCMIFLCESYLVWFNSLFGESTIFLGIFMVTACGIHLAVTPRGRGSFLVFLLLFACRFLLCAKAQMLMILPILLLLICVFAVYHRPLRLGKLIPYTMAILIGVGILSYEGITVYRDNAGISERQTIWQSVFFGALMISDDPVGDMEELGIDTAMAADIGKDAYQPDEDYVISPNSEEADAAFYDHVTTFDMVKYYLKRPAKLIHMLNYAAGVSQEMYNGFRVYLGQNYSGEHDTVDRLGAWLYWRPLFAFSSFWGYVLVYGVLLSVCVFVMIHSRFDIKKKLLAMVYIGVMFIGAIQYPLSVIGNGFADNQKQMFGFMLCHDLLTVITCAGIIKLLWRYRGQLNRKSICGFWRQIRNKTKGDISDEKKGNGGVWNKA